MTHHRTILTVLGLVALSASGQGDPCAPPLSNMELTTGIGTMVLLSTAGPATANHPCTSPLVFDLGNDGRVDTTGLMQVAAFDSNGDGKHECIAWAEDGILWLDSNRNGRVDGGHELFGNSTILRSGRFAENGFEALAEFDNPGNGGNGDGYITPLDSIWPLLTMWIDENLDAKVEKAEAHSLDALEILAIDLSFVESSEVDGNANLLPFQGRFLKRLESPLGGKVERWLKVIDVFFLAVDSCDEIPATR